MNLTLLTTAIGYNFFTNYEFKHYKQPIHYKLYENLIDYFQCDYGEGFQEMHWQIEDYIDELC